MTMTDNRETPTTGQVLLIGLLVIVLTLLAYGLLGGFRARAEAQEGGAVIVALHGGGGNGDNLCRRLNEAWGDVGVPVLCPTGEGNHWNSGWGRSGSTRDDIAFLQELTAGYDTVLVLGSSQGGMMALTWACADDRITSVVAKSSLLPRGVVCENTSARIVHWHGKLDRVIPMAGDEYVIPLWRDRRVFGGCVSKAFRAHSGAWVVKGCGYESRVFPEWEHGGWMPGFERYALKSLLRGLSRDL